MKKLFTILLFYAFSGVFGQNLVPNNSFETLSSCPTADGQLDKAIPWFNPNHYLSISMSDLMNECAQPFPTTLVDVPQNGWGYQYARTGLGYANIYSYSKSYPFDERDYISVQLINPLITNRKYYVGYYACLAAQDSLWNSVYPNSGSAWAIDCMGLLFTDTAININNTLVIPAIPQIMSPPGYFLKDTLNWMLVSGLYTALGNEQYITIGNFKDNASTNAIIISNTSITDAAGYFIDDVFVYDVTNLQVANAGVNHDACKGSAIQIGMPTDTGYTYHWQPAIGLSNANISNPIANPNVTTTYFLTVNYQGYYETKDSVTITVINCDTLIPKPNELVIINAFTPNNDGVNDVFHVKGNNIAQINATVFNRWGQELYTWNELTGGWNGKYKGNEVAAGTYFYVVTVVYDNGTTGERHGAVTLVR
jgi:gliding motility-associated-like protein